MFAQAWRKWLHKHVAHSSNNTYFITNTPQMEEQTDYPVASERPVVYAGFRIRFPQHP